MSTILTHSEAVYKVYGIGNADYPAEGNHIAHPAHVPIDPECGKVDAVEGEVGRKDYDGGEYLNHEFVAGPPGLHVVPYAHNEYQGAADYQVPDFKPEKVVHPGIQGEHNEPDYKPEKHPHPAEPGNVAGMNFASVYGVVEAEMAGKQ